MADNNNPIKYSDLIKPDSSITDLIKQLEELKGIYESALAKVKKKRNSLVIPLKKYPVQQKRDVKLFVKLLRMQKDYLILNQNLRIL